MTSTSPYCNKGIFFSQHPQLETDPGGDPLNKQRAQVTLCWPLIPLANRFNIFSRGWHKVYFFSFRQSMCFGGYCQGSFNKIYPPFKATVNLLPSGWVNNGVEPQLWTVVSFSVSQWIGRQFGDLGGVPWQNLCAYLSLLCIETTLIKISMSKFLKSF